MSQMSLILRTVSPKLPKAAFVAGYAGQMLGWYGQGQPASYIASVIGAAVLLFVVGKLKGA